jgi:hypothetical protein
MHSNMALCAVAFRQAVSLRRVVRLVAAVLVIANCLFHFVGCGPNYGGRKEIKGTVKLKSQPVDDGFIEFIPLSDAIPTRSGAQILGGAYRIPAESGLMPGTYRVSITAGDGRTKASAAEDEPPGPTGANIVSKDRIPKEYNIESKQDVEVTEKGPNVFDYDIP